MGHMLPYVAAVTRVTFGVIQFARTLTRMANNCAFGYDNIAFGKIRRHLHSDLLGFLSII